MIATAQGLIYTLIVGSILNMLCTQFDIEHLTKIVMTIGSSEDAATYTPGGLAFAWCIYRLCRYRKNHNRNRLDWTYSYLLRSPCYFEYISLQHAAQMGLDQTRRFEA